MGLIEQGLFGDMPIVAPNVLSEKFILPPFSVLDARSGAWQDRKRHWIAMGIDSGAGRDAEFVDAAAHHTNPVAGKIRALGATSIFDPVLTELLYAWFTPPDAQVYDPFAGGSVRGLVAGIMGRCYYGIDIRGEQIAENYSQLGALKNGSEMLVDWDCADGAAECPPSSEAIYDFVIACPPYGDLEVYSNDPRDLSNMSERDFLNAHHRAIEASCKRLRPGRFAAWVVGDYRKKDGSYVGLPWFTQRSFFECGMKLYNEAVLVQSIGTLGLRTSWSFGRGLKLGKGHQNVFIFVKPPIDEAVAYAGEIG